MSITTPLIGGVFMEKTYVNCNEMEERYNELLSKGTSFTKVFIEFLNLDKLNQIRMHLPLSAEHYDRVSQKLRKATVENITQLLSPFKELTDKDIKYTHSARGYSRILKDTFELNKTHPYSNYSRKIFFLRDKVSELYADTSLTDKTTSDKLKYLNFTLDYLEKLLKSITRQCLKKGATNLAYTSLL